jgi:hypothetical protein
MAAGMVTWRKRRRGQRCVQALKAIICRDAGRGNAACPVRTGLFVEVRIENPNLGDIPHGKLAAARRAANRFRGGSVVHTETLFLVGTYVGVNPRDLVREVALDDRQACFGTGIIDRNQKSIRKLSFDYVPWHDVIPVIWLMGACVANNRRALLPANPANYLYCALRTPKLGHPYPSATH